MMDTPVSILLVEDNPSDVRLLRHMMSRAGFPGFELTCCELLSEAVERSRQLKFDVILLDLSLPDSTGLQSFVTLQERAPSVPIVVLTGLADEELATRAVRQGAQDYLVKGQVDSNLLARAIRYAIERKRAEEKLLGYQKRLRSLATKISLTEEQERRRIASDVHDHIGQTLALAKIKLGSLQEKTGDEALGEPIQEIRSLLEQAIGYTRSLTFELSSPVLYEMGFESAVEALVEQVQRRHQLRTEFEDDKSQKPLSEDIRSVLYRAVRELLFNIVKHAHAGSVKVSIRKVENDICIKVIDDGVGFDPSKIPPMTETSGGFGLFNIQERLDFLGGHLQVHSCPGQGTQMVIRAPLKLKNPEKVRHRSVF